MLGADSSMKYAADRLRTLRRRHKYLIRQIEEDTGEPGTAKRHHLLAEASALGWAIQELDDFRPELHSHTIKVVKEALVTHLRNKGVDESVIEMLREKCNRLNLGIDRQPLAVDLAEELAEQGD